MLLTQRSLKSRFRAIFTSISLTTPPNLADRIKSLTEAIVHDSLNNIEIVDEIDLALASITIGAYWHQDLQEVRSRILFLQTHSNADIAELVLAYAIALACREQLQPRLFVNQIYDDFNKRRALSRTPESQQHCLNQLQLAQELVKQGASMITAHRSDYGLSDAIASSFYYFLSTPHRWQIVTERARSHMLTNYQQVTIQSGALTAAYLGEIGNVRNTTNYQGILTKGAILGDWLWAEWAGVYNCDQETLEEQFTHYGSPMS